MHKISQAAMPNNKGFTLIEVTIVLGVIAVVVGAIFTAYSSMVSQNRIKKAAEQVTVLTNQIRANYAGRAKMEPADITTALINAEIAPAGWVVGGTISNPWNGTIIVQGINTGTHIRFTLNSIDSIGDCYGLTNNLLNLAKSNGLVGINGTTITPITTFTNIRSSACSGSGNNYSTYFDLLLKT